MLFRKEQWKKALEVYSKMIELDPADGRYLLNRSAVNLKLELSVYVVVCIVFLVADLWHSWQDAEEDAVRAEALLKSSGQQALTLKAMYRAACAKMYAEYCAC